MAFNLDIFHIRNVRTTVLRDLRIGTTVWRKLDLKYFESTNPILMIFPAKIVFGKVSFITAK